MCSHNRTEVKDGKTICLSCGHVFADKPQQEQHIVLDLYRREDGGLRIAGRDTARGLVLSGELPAMVLDKVWPALFAMKHPITIHDYGN